MLTAAALPVASQAQGTWSTNPHPWPVHAIHMLLLPDQRIMIFNRSRDAAAERDFNVATIPYPYDGPGQVIPGPMIDGQKRELFCAGHTLDENGDAIVAGGHWGPGPTFDRHGIADVWLFQWQTDQWRRLSDMAHGRWYPTVIQLPDRTFMASMGEYCDGPLGNCTITQNRAPDLWTTIPGEPADLLANLPQAPQDVFYPHLFVHPKDGRVFYAPAGRVGEDLRWQSALYDPLTLAWEPFAPIPPGFPNVRWSYSSCVMMDGRIYRSGGHRTSGSSEDASKACVTIDLNSENPQWQVLPDMLLRRTNHCLVALPDGRIMAMGGNLRGDRMAASECTTPEVFDTEASNPSWSLVQSLQGAGQPKIGRGYHLTSLLLPDARVVVAGGEPEFYNLPTWPTQRTAQFYTPQYGSHPNWADFRPQIVGDHPTEIRYGRPFCLDVDLSPGRTLSRIRLVSLGSVTHAFNMNQQYVTLEFEPHPLVPGRFIVHPPETPFVATPGYFMLFAVDNERAPSIARIVKLSDFERAFPDEVAITEGLPADTASTLEVVLPDNRWLASSIDSMTAETQRATVAAVANVTYTNISRLRVRIEHKTTPCATTATVELRNWATLEFEAVAETECSGADREFEVLIETDAGRFVSPLGRIEARLCWKSDSPLTPFSLNVDRIEFGVEPFQNFPPTIDPIADLDIDEHEPLAFAVPASDLDLPIQPLQIMMEGAPEEAVLGSDGVIRWTPGESDGGRDFSITVRASDGLAEASRTFQLAVRETNENPVLEPIPNQSVQEMSLLTFDASATDADTPVQALSFELGPNAPAGAAITPPGHFTWTPNEADGPTEWVTVLVTDGHGGTASQSVRIDVREVNEPPVLHLPPDQTIVEGTTLDLTLSATDADLPANRLTFSLESPPVGASVTPDGRFSWTPSEFQGEGVYVVNVRVVDDGEPALSDVGSFSVTVGESYSGTPVDLEGVYIAPAPSGSAIARTFMIGGEAVSEVSGGLGAWDGTFTPFSDHLKPPTGFETDLRGKSFAATLEPGGQWSMGSSFVIGLGQAAGPRVALRLSRGLVGMEAWLEGSTGQAGPFAAPESDRYDFALSLDQAGASSATLRALDGPSAGQEVLLGPLPPWAADSVGFLAGFETTAGVASLATMRLSGARTDAGANVLALLAPVPYIKANDPARYLLLQANMTRPAGGYQAFLESTGPQVLLQGAYSPEPYTFAVGGPAYDPIGPQLYLARGMALQGRARLDDTLLATLEFRPTAAGALGLLLRPDNGLGLPTVFADDGALGEYIVPVRRPSNRIVVDDEPPVFEDLVLMQGTHDVLASGHFLAGELTIEATVRDEGGGLAGHPSLSLDLEPLGTNLGEDLIAKLVPASGNRFQSVVHIPPQSGCSARLQWMASDRSGNVQTSGTPPWLVDPPRLTLHIRHQHTWQGEAGLIRALEIRVGTGPGGNAPIVLDRDVVFDSSGAATIELGVAEGLLCGPYTQVSVKDPLHGLRKRVTLEANGSEYRADIDLASGDLNRDNRVDIADYIVLAVRYGQTVDPNTPLPHGQNHRHPDLDGSGEIDIGDLSILVASWFETGDPPPGNYRPRSP